MRSGRPWNISILGGYWDIKAESYKKPEIHSSMDQSKDAMRPVDVHGVRFVYSNPDHESDSPTPTLQAILIR